MVRVGLKLPARFVVVGIWLSVLGVLILYFGTHLFGIVATTTFSEHPVDSAIKATVTHGASIVYHTGLVAGVIGGVLVVPGSGLVITGNR